MGAFDHLLTPATRPYVATPKPAKGSAKAARVDRRLKDEAQEDRAKTAARKRDGYRCRWPSCDCEARRDRIEVAHIVNKSNGGENHTRNLICLCVARHQGRPSLHSGDLSIRPVNGKAGADGPVSFWMKAKGGKWFMVAQERHIHVLERD